MPPLKDATSGSAVVVHQTDAGGSSVATAFEGESYLSLEQQIDNIADAGTEWDALKSDIETTFNNYMAGLADDLHSHPDARLVRLRTAGGQATDFFRFNAITWAALRPDSADFGTGTDVHEAFCDGTEASSGDHAYEHVYVAAYPLSLSNGEVVSQPGTMPYVNRNLDEAIAHCNDTDIVGFEGLHRLWSIWDRSLVINHCMHAGYQPMGNTSFGVSHADPGIAGISQSSTGATLTGSMGVGSSHTGESHGIYDLVGNVWEWCYGLETVDGRIKTVPDNRSSVANRNQLIESSNWLSHVAANGHVEIVTSATDQVQNGPDGSSYISGSGGFEALGQLNRTALRRAIIAPISGSLNPAGAVLARTHGDRALLVGGSWDNAGNAGLAALNLRNAPSNRYSDIGFRSAFAV